MIVCRDDSVVRLQSLIATRGCDIHEVYEVETLYLNLEIWNDVSALGCAAFSGAPRIIDFLLECGVANHWLHMEVAKVRDCPHFHLIQHRVGSRVYTSFTPRHLSMAKFGPDATITLHLASLKKMEGEDDPVEVPGDEDD